MSFKINDTVTWVGKIDWELKQFHGNELSTDKGSSYNSYLIKDEKTVLIDTVWTPFTTEFITNLKKEVDIQKIDYIVMNHSEVDHSGALVELMKEIPNTPIYCAKNGVRILKGLYHQDWNFVEVKTGDTLDIGKHKLTFIEAPMLHWPDTMFTYLSGENILFSNDGFGQHYASELMYNDKVDQSELYHEALKYYANILAPFNRQVAKKIEEILNLNLPIDMICPSHGIIWRDNPMQIINKYAEWANEYAENQITIIYDSMWNATRRMAECITEGITSNNKDVVVKIINSGKTDKNDVIVEAFKSKIILLGSSTINNGILASTASILEMIKGFKFKGKKGAAFGSYGWSGESIKLITEELEKAGIKTINSGIRELWTPDEEALERCREFGKNIAEEL
ncbi:MULTISPECIES: anaerobic nitric oxide reductase flavorubredoxin [Clostridium]|uniref:Anaerobic nitric oxide reductase flavorubredoxin n=1 Tax=Clostridium aquiflavi TaxID=3073603 RepID=A0ABU1ECB6_9CLOT|nr:MULTISPECIES: anaerobic nitric oxide reductase flavorubredoxin [unclassified Clostridium]MBN1038358.1 anaerobic nitric oxide reductase flavorubredoxin [Clostridium botulinum]MBN1045108.1 anaerobic nitric oxide reductase flavorubredoxin [Clostridium botulinum]MDR5585967.1 anaerobic nitric oxide reductase flavorubredoxin [Clostridium sp. 5N-1]NFG60966.1 anaerobic nitric oxide reductase flavorubredoxin [Clostridium botulinum]NFQ09449.1 anaerobic nitric oxide reductase flavorubredoxin [Clostrid